MVICPDFGEIGRAKRSTERQRKMRIDRERKRGGVMGDTEN